mmetsp:Transcript_19274/g.53735  ORF Transcript_19274/g.53735 Transcript_19274/m.53735 type:complete len:366 (-) Transcript_19274:1041-2138(-)
MRFPLLTVAGRWIHHVVVVRGNVRLWRGLAFGVRWSRNRNRSRFRSGFRCRVRSGLGSRLWYIGSWRRSFRRDRGFDGGESTRTLEAPFGEFLVKRPCLFGDFVFAIQPTKGRERPSVATIVLDELALLVFFQFGSLEFGFKVFLARLPEFVPGIAIDCIEGLAGIDRFVENCFEVHERGAERTRVRRLPGTVAKASRVIVQVSGECGNGFLRRLLFVVPVHDWIGLCILENLHARQRRASAVIVLVLVRVGTSFKGIELSKIVLIEFANEERNTVEVGTRRIIHDRRSSLDGLFWSALLDHLLLFVILWSRRHDLSGSGLIGAVVASSPVGTRTHGAINDRNECIDAVAVIGGILRDWTRNTKQ